MIAAADRRGRPHFFFFSFFFTQFIQLNLLWQHFVPYNFILLFRGSIMPYCMIDLSMSSLKNSKKNKKNATGKTSYG